MERTGEPMMPNSATRHHIHRTSPKGKGQPFIGTCYLCGTPNLRAEDALKPCPNQRGLTADEALLEAIDPDRSVVDAE